MEQVQKAISLGVSKINVNTDLQVVFAEATRKYIESGADQQGKGYDPNQPETDSHQAGFCAGKSKTLTRRHVLCICMGLGAV